MALAGVRVIELAGLAPAPFCGMILADFGAKVIRVDRTKVAMSVDTQARGKKSVAINLKTPEGAAVLKKLCVHSDVVLEPYRKGQDGGTALGALPLETFQKSVRCQCQKYSVMCFCCHGDLGHRCDSAPMLMLDCVLAFLGIRGRKMIHLNVGNAEAGRI